MQYSTHTFLKVQVLLSFPLITTIPIRFSGQNCTCNPRHLIASESEGKWGHNAGLQHGTVPGAGRGSAARIVQQRATCSRQTCAPSRLVRHPYRPLRTALPRLVSLMQRTHSPRSAVQCGKTTGGSLPHHAHLVVQLQVSHLRRPIRNSHRPRTCTVHRSPRR